MKPKTISENRVISFIVTGGLVLLILYVLFSSVQIHIVCFNPSNNERTDFYGYTNALSKIGDEVTIYGYVLYDEGDGLKVQGSTQSVYSLGVCSWD